MTRPEEEEVTGVEGDDDESLADKGKDTCLARVVVGSRGTMFDVCDGLDGVVTNGKVAHCAGRVKDD